MDTEQIQQRMRERRATIDATLDRVSRATAAARRRSVPAVMAIAASIAALMLWKRYRNSRRAPGPRHVRLLAAG